MNNNIDHFETCVPNNRKNKERLKVADGDSMEVKGRGTVTWKLDDDDGLIHKVKSRDTLCVSNLDRCLLSPQHADQELEKEPGTMNATKHGSNCVLVMPGFKKTIPNDEEPTFQPHTHPQDANTTGNH